MYVYVYIYIYIYIHIMRASYLIDLLLWVSASRLFPPHESSTRAPHVAKKGRGAGPEEISAGCRGRVLVFLCRSK